MAILNDLGEARAKLREKKLADLPVRKDKFTSRLSRKYKIDQPIGQEK